MGVLNLNKPAGWTSHDVVARVRRLAGQRRVGHAGTLDPLAVGVLPVLLGRATRLADCVGEGRKRYTAAIALGTATTTDDGEGEVTRQAPVPVLDRAQVQTALAAFTGEIEQVPPRFSALKVAGQRAYARARRGEDVVLQARPVTVYALDLLNLAPGRLVLDVRCSRGTYVRSLARDLAVALGTVGHLAALVRTEVGPFRLADAVTLDDLEARGVPACLLPADAALPDAPRFDADERQVADLALGRPVPAPGVSGDLVRVYDPLGRMWLVGMADGSTLRPRIRLA